ncbi:MAG: hypothetical protein ACXAB2_08315 [Candidatus Hodarchaeales archaeon]
MVKVREIHQNLIQTALDQLPSQIKQYSPKDKILLNEFLATLSLYKDARHNRKQLSFKIDEYINKHLGTDQYLQTPFLWFSVNFYQNANLLLEVSKFHADNFYEYLGKQIRSNSNIQGLFQLIKQNIPLTDLKWELLQYQSNKMPYPLSTVQLKIISAIYACIQNKGIQSLNQRKLIECIKEKVNTSSISHLSPELKRFFTLIEGRWYTRFHSPAFGFVRLFFYIQLRSGVTISQIFKSLDENSINLNSSDFYQVRTDPDTYLGILLTPGKSLKSVSKHLSGFQEDNQIFIKNLTKIQYIRRSVSIDLYSINKGWVKLNKTALRKLKGSILEDDQTTLSSKVYLTSKPNMKWNYESHPLSNQLKQLYIEIPEEYSYENLLLSPSNSEEGSALTRDEIGLLKLLHTNNVIQAGFIPYRLIYEYSLDSYWLILPELSENQLKNLLSMIPYCEIYNIDDSILIWTRLMDYQVDWIQNELKWEIFPILRVTVNK